MELLAHRSAGDGHGEVKTDKKGAALCEVNQPHLRVILNSGSEENEGESREKGTL